MQFYMTLSSQFPLWNHSIPWLHMSSDIFGLDELADREEGQKLLTFQIQNDFHEKEMNEERTVCCQIYQQIMMIHRILIWICVTILRRTKIGGVDSVL